MWADAYSIMEVEVVKTWELERETRRETNEKRTRHKHKEENRCDERRRVEKERTWLTLRPPSEPQKKREEPERAIRRYTGEEKDEKGGV